ncbi:MAG: S-layer homology domain-containing protein, partial [bacterium]
MSSFRKKPLVILLTAVMILGLLPTAAFAASFKDVEGHWAQQQIETWLQKGLVSGYPDGTFRPNQPVTRAEFVTFVNRAFGIKAAGGEEVFSDVPASAWFF